MGFYDNYDPRKSLLSYNPNQGKINVTYGSPITKAAEVQCVAEGGTWDPLTLTCKMPDREDRDPINTNNNTYNPSNSGKHDDNYIVGVPAADGNQWGFTSIKDLVDGGGAGHSGDTFSDGIWGDGGSPGHRNGSSDDNSYITGVPKADGNQWGFTSIKDMVDGGGAGHSGDTYSDGLWGDGKSIYTYINDGGSVPVYANNGLLANHPYDREGKEFDTVDARLTPGEFVVDADSAHRYMPLLEKINDWEPGENTKLNGLLSKKGEKLIIKKEMEDGTKVTMESSADQENDMAPIMDAMSGGQPLLPQTMPQQDLLPQPQPVQMNLGGLLGGLFDTPYNRQRRNARNAMNSAVRGAGVSAGLQSSGRALDNIAANNRSIGLQTNSLGGFDRGGYSRANFSSKVPPTSTFGSQAQAIGQGQQEIANAEGAYQNELSRIEGTQNRDEILAANRAENQAIEAAKVAAEAETAANDKNEVADNAAKDIIKLSERAGTLLQDASKAGDIINGHIKISAVEADADSIISKFTNFVTQGANVAAGAFNQTARVRDEARYKFAALTYPKSISAYTKLRALANKMVFPILATGDLGVNPTDADVELAKSAQFDLSAPSGTWAAQLNQLIDINGGTGQIPSVIAVPLATDEVSDPEVTPKVTPEVVPPEVVTPDVKVRKFPFKWLGGAK